MATVRLIYGPPRSERPARIDGLLHDYWGRSLLLTPTHAYAARRRERLLLEGSPPGAWGNPVRQFTDFALWLLEAEGVRVRKIGDFERRLLLERCLNSLDRAGTLEVFAAARSRPGLTTHLLRIINQLKQGAVEPADFRERIERGGGASPVDRVVGEAYAAYQNALLSAGAYDVPGLYWEAELRCKGGRPRVLEGIDALLLDGFDDFTPSEFRLVEAVEKHVELLVFGVNYDADPDRQDLYAIPAATVKAIRQRFDAAVESVDLPARRRCSEYAAHTIFWRTARRVPEGLERDVTVLTCTDPNHEIECIARRIKGLILEQDCPPDAVAVVFPSIAEVAAQVRAVFEEFGLPLRMSSPPSIADSAVGAFLLRFFEAVDTWAREPVLDVLLSPWFPSPEPEAGRWFPALARAAQILSGREVWTERLEGLIARAAAGRTDADTRIDRMPGIREAAETLLAQAARLREFAAGLPQRASRRCFAEAVEGLLDGLGMESALDALAEDGVAQAEGHALAALRDLLAVLAQADDGETLSRQGFLDHLTKGLQETSFTWPDAPAGVLCCEPGSVRNLEVAHVFFGGLIEGAAPRPPAMSAVYPDRDLERLRAAGIDLENTGKHAERERLLFFHVLEAARNSLTLSSSLAKRGGAPASPSPFLSEVLTLFPRGALVEGPVPRPDSFVPLLGEAASLRDFRNAVFYTRSGLRSAFAQDGAALETGVAVERQRHNGEPFGRYDGVLADEALIGDLRLQYDDAYQFSVSQLETYIDCPFRFFAQRLLGVVETEAPDAEFDPRVRGILLHRALQSFHRYYRGKAMAELELEEAQATLRRIVGEVFAAERWRSGTVAPGVLDVERQRMEATLDRYVHIEAERGESQWRPEHFEPAFGQVRGTVEDPLFSAEPFVLRTGAGPVCFAGQIDRVDCAGTDVRLVDYKTGQTPKAKDITSGRSIQLSIYAWALERLLMKGAQCAEAWFVTPGKKARQQALGGRGEQREQREENVLSRVATAVDGIRAGRFPPMPYEAKTSCTYCPFRDACRYEEARITRKRAAVGTGNDAC